MTRTLRCVCALVVSFAWCGAALAQAKAPAAPAEKEGTGEERAARALDAARGNPLDLRAFLVRMPKGGELHYHLGGGIYAETFIRDGAEDHLCVNLASLSMVKRSGADCASADVPVEKAFQDQHLYDALVDAFSMRGFVPTPGVTGHDHFFDSFAKFGAVDPRHTGEWLDEAATRAAAQNEQYLELMVTPDFTRTAIVSRTLGWHEDRSMSEFREQLLARGLRDDVTAARAYLDQAEASRKQIEHCGEPSQTPACSVQIRYLYQVLRAFPPEQVFAQTLIGFEAASADPRFVGINYVQPEDDHTAMAYYALHMRMLEFLHSIYPQVHISLHAGEIAPGMVPPDGLCCHIRLAVEHAHAERIGHGVDVMYEDKPYDLLKEMAAKHVAVEINLTSNDVILGIAGKAHPFPIYRRFGVPVALSTDDEGVSRIDLTHEYVRAVESYALTYADLKKIVRTSIEHSFLAGASLWREPDAFGHAASACSQDSLGAAKPSPGCAAFLQSGEKAQQQWELERRFTAFEATF
ncbi:MAG TPA: adenosine deaminase [Verrucomicrobiae bacterium]|nr:adenosine deaminase [Verrucomicrobiae bacterium]